MTGNTNNFICFKIFWIFYRTSDCPKWQPSAFILFTKSGKSLIIKFTLYFLVIFLSFLILIIFDFGYDLSRSWKYLTFLEAKT